MIGKIFWFQHLGQLLFNHHLLVVEDALSVELFRPVSEHSGLLFPLFVFPLRMTGTSTRTSQRLSSGSSFVSVVAASPALSCRACCSSFMDSIFEDSSFSGFRICGLRLSVLLRQRMLHTNHVIEHLILLTLPLHLQGHIHFDFLTTFTQRIAWAVIERFPRLPRLTFFFLRSPSWDFTWFRWYFRRFCSLLSQPWFHFSLQFSFQAPSQS